MKTMVAILPVYADGVGNVSRVLYEDGSEEIVPVRVSRILDRLFYAHLLSRRAVEEYYGGFLGIRRNVPAVIARDLVYVPVKVRKPRVRDDGAYGYVLHQAIAGQEESGILLVDGRVIETLHSRPMLEKVLLRGHRVSVVRGREEA